MIDEQHPMQIGMFPMDVKCHTPQQQQQQQHQQPQQPTQQLQQHQTNMLLNGSERMLTTPTAIASIATATTTTAATKPMSGSTTTTNGHSPVNINNMNKPTAATMLSSDEVAKSGKNGTITSTTTTAMTSVTNPTNVNGSCNNLSSNSNNNHNNISRTSGHNTNSHSHSHNNNNNNNHQQTQQQNGHEHEPTAAGPGPPHGLTSGIVPRAALGECSLNGSVICGATGALCVNNNNNNNNNNDENICNSNSMSLAMQQQHQHQQQHIQLHLPHPHPRPTSNAILQDHHPAAMLSNTSVCATALGPVNAVAAIANSLPSQLHCIANGICGGASAAGGLVGMGMSLPAPLTQCGYCCQPICDRYIMRVVDTSFHESCLKCATCSLHLVHSCFARDGKLYCRIDYERLFMRNRCLGCGHKIACDELVMRTLENVFHLKCFACVVCGALLKKGEQYVVKQGQLFCRFDYEKEVEMLQGYDFYGDDLFPPKLDGRRGPKRPRTILNTQQRRAFKASFEVSPKPCRKVRENLAKETGLSLRIVQVWFQNQRAKVKKIQKKAKQEPATRGASDSQDSQESDSSLAKIKDEAHSDTESLLESPFSSCGAGGGSSSDGVAKLRCIKDENENAPFSCMETNKENCNKTNEPILNTILGLSYATFQQLMSPFSQTPMINPIDRLYSMQNSYFRPEEVGSYGDCNKDGGEH